MIRLGVDLLAVAELDRLRESRWFDRYAFAREELAHAQSLAADRGREFLAGRFAAKEAVLKTLGIGLFQGVAPRDICVTRSDCGCPQVSLRGTALRAAQSAGISQVTLSITHKRGQVIAVAAGS